MAYDITPLDTSTRNKLYAQMNQVGDQILSQADIDALMARYGGMEDQGLRSAQDAAMLELSQQFSPAFDALRARNYGLYQGGGAQRDYSKILGQAMTGLTQQRMGLQAESAARKAAYLRQLAQSRISAREGLGSQLYGRMLTTQKKPSFGQQALAFGGQLLGAGVGAMTGGGMGGQSMGGGNLTGSGQFQPGAADRETMWGQQNWKPQMKPFSAGVY